MRAHNKAMAWVAVRSVTLVFAGVKLDGEVEFASKDLEPI